MIRLLFNEFMLSVLLSKPNFGKQNRGLISRFEDGYKVEWQQLFYQTFNLFVFNR